MKEGNALEGSVSIITGARGVIGRGIARELAASGSDVVLQVERDQTPEDMGRAAVFLATSGNITGQSITMDGGITSRAI